MTAYLISEVVVLDQDAWRRYGELASPAIAKCGGTYLVRRVQSGDDCCLFEGWTSPMGSEIAEEGPIGGIAPAPSGSGMNPLAGNQGPDTAGGGTSRWSTRPEVLRIGTTTPNESLPHRRTWEDVA